MRVIRSQAELEKSFNAAQSEAKAAFGNGSLYMEKFIERPRHIEFQVLGDLYGNVVCLGERECSIQRRHQKLLEESPSMHVSEDLRHRVSRALESCLSSIGYVNAGTVEFLMDERGNLHFIEMNTRVQVEHPVTEMVTGIDIVKSQLLIASGASINDLVPSVTRYGHAIECRINAEHPEKFTPSAGTIRTFRLPGGNGIRIDTAAYAGATIPPYYDSLVAKLITHGRDRTEAIMRMRRALEMFEVEGIHTTIPLHRRILDDVGFEEGNIDTKYLERLFAPQNSARAA
jgi:acetyl-CoA carboxylase biotin carboxylase subunit